MSSNKNLEYKQQVKMVNQLINGIKRRSHFISWNEVSEFAHELHQILEIIEKDLLPNYPTLAIEQLEKLFNIDQSIFERVDDSNGEIGTFYYCVSELWGKSWLALKVCDDNLLAQKILTLLVCNEYAAKDHIIEHSSQALGKPGLETLESLIVKNKKCFSQYSLPWMLEAIADAQGDVNKYISLIKKYSSINEITVGNIAERLIKKWRGQEAINWLLHQPNDIGIHKSDIEFDPNKVSDSKRYQLLLQAYDSETMLEQAQSLRWILFTKTLSKNYYDGLLKHLKADDAIKIKTKALKFACNDYLGDIGSLLRFLLEIQDLDTLSDIIIKKYVSLSVHDYYLYRPLSKTLATARYPLAACLLRRQLIDGILGRAQSKYYRYAVSDLKIAKRYAEQVNDWQGMLNHDGYMDGLKSDHGRKSAFWSKVTEAISND